MEPASCLVLWEGLGLVRHRLLYKAMLEKIPVDDVLQNLEIVPGGDLRVKGNQWLRSSYVLAGLTKVPRETQVRLAVEKLSRKKRLCTLHSNTILPFVGRALAPFSKALKSSNLRAQQSGATARAKARACRMKQRASGYGSRWLVNTTLSFHP